MNAPRQGLFASLLFISFSLHAVLMVLATNNFLDENRANQGAALTRQLVNDSLQELNPVNSVALALVINRYVTDPSIASVRILDAQNQVVATGGSNKTRGGEVFVRDAAINEQRVGKVEVTLLKPSIGEQLHNIWLPLLLSSMVHLLLWLGYRLIARPTRQEYKARLARETQLQQEIQRLADTLEQERHQASLAIAKAQQLYKPTQRDITERATITALDENEIYLSIQFYDPKQLLSSVNHLSLQSYYNVAQLFLNHTRKQCIQAFDLDEQDIEIIQPVMDDGALIRGKQANPQVIKAMIQMAVVFELLSEATYKRFRKDKRFALQTRLALSEAVPAMQINAQKAAVRLGQYLHGKDIAIYLSKPTFKECRHQYELAPLPHPSNPLTRDAVLLHALSSEQAALAEQMRDDILAGRS